MEAETTGSGEASGDHLVIEIDATKYEVHDPLLSAARLGDRR